MPLACRIHVTDDFRVLIFYFQESVGVIKQYLGHPADDLADATVPGERDDVYLHAVAGAEDGRLLNVVEVTQLRDGARPLRFRHGQLLPHLHRRSVNAQPDHHDAALLFRIP